MKPQDKELKIIIKDTFYILGSDEQKHDKEFREHTVNTAIKQLISWRNDYAKECLDDVIKKTNIVKDVINKNESISTRQLRGIVSAVLDERGLNDKKDGEL